MKIVKFLKPFIKNSVKFLGNIIDGDGIHLDNDKTETKRNFPTPTKMFELQHLMGMERMKRFIPAPKNEKQNAQEESSNKIKEGHISSRKSRSL